MLHHADLIRRRILLAGAAALAASASTQAAPHGVPTSTAFSVRTSDGLQLAAQAQGDPAAPELLLIHGLNQSRLSWDRQLAAPELAGFRIVSFDLRGHGDSDKPANPTRYSDPARWASDLQEVIAASSLRRPILVPWSFGGLVVGYYLALRGGVDLAGINFVDAVTNPGPAVRRPVAVSFDTRLASEDLSQRSQAIADFLDLCFASPPPLAEYKRMLVYNGMVARAVQTGLGLLTEPGIDRGLAAFCGPTLVTFGARDSWLFPEAAARIVRLSRRARLSVYADAGHSPFFESAGRFNRELAAFAKSAVVA